MKTLLIVSAMAEELAGLPPRLQRELGSLLHLEFGLIGIGKVEAAQRTERLLSELRPAAVILAGVAGALRPDLSLGQVGVVTGAIDADLDVRAWRPGYTRGEHPLHRTRIHYSDTKWVSRALALAGPRGFPAYVATGSAFLDEAGKAAFLRDVWPELAVDAARPTTRPDLIDMETAAFLQVAATHRIPALALRSVSDTLEGDAATDFEAFLASAALSYAELIGGLGRQWASGN